MKPFTKHIPASAVNRQPLPFTNLKYLQNGTSNTMILRYAAIIIPAIALVMLRKQLPFQFPQLFLVFSAYFALSTILYLLSFNKKISQPVCALFPYTDILIFPFIFQFTGGFLSPFIFAAMLVTAGNGLTQTNNRNLQYLAAIIVFSYLSVSLLQKYGVLANQVGYSFELMHNSAFFFFIIGITTILISAYILFFQTLFNRTRKTIDELTGSFHATINGTAAVANNDFFVNLARYSSETLDLRCVFIAEIIPMRKELHTLAIWNNGRCEENYRLPFTSVIANEIIEHPDTRLFSSNLVKKYQNDPLCKLFNITSIFGLPLIDSIGKTIGVLCALHDSPVKNKHLLNQHFPIFAFRAAAELERAIIYEKRNVIEEQLLHAQKMHAIGHLAGIIAHDFNNIISAISGYAGLLKKKLPVGDRNYTYVEHIIEAGKNASSMTSQLSALVKNETPHFNPVDVHAVIQNVISMLQAKFGPEIHLTSNLAAKPSFTSGEESLLHTSLINLGINAHESCGSASSTVSFTTSTIEIDSGYFLCQSFSIPPGQYIRVEVSDNGCGMSKDVITHIFEPFFTTKQKSKGTGLGLTNVWRYVETYKCAIEVNSTPGKGSSFVLYLPLFKEVAKNNIKIPVFHSDISNSKTVLIVDDEPSVRDIYSEILCGIGYTVYTSCDGNEALDFINNGKISVDLVLLDMIMPYMNGPDAFRAIRTLRPEIRFLLMSGTANNDHLPDLLKEQGTMFFQKPCDDEQLINYVNSMLSSQN